MKTEPRNFLTSPPKLGNPATTLGVLFKKDYYDHIKDPYDRRKELAKKEREEHHKRLQEKQFYSMHKGGKTFANEYDTYALEAPLPVRKA